MSARDLSARDVAALEAEARLRTMFDSHYDFIWRSVRRLGVPDANADDAAQEVFVVATRKLASIEPGKERSFLFGTAVRVASDARRSLARRREDPADPSDTISRAAAPEPRADALVEQKRARALLDEAIDTLADDVKPVFVLFELEGLTMVEIAACLSLAPGTVASRLRRGRASFRDKVRALQRKGERDV